MTGLPPHLSYLEIVRSATLGAVGTAQVVLTPDTGQYWLPIIAQCNLKSPAGNVLGKPASCLLYAGSAGVPDSTMVKDFTRQGENDTSTILSGSVIQPGLSVIFSWFGGVPGEIATGRLIGLSSTTPPTQGIVPEVPGQRFFGAELAGASTALPVLVLGASIAVATTINNIPVGVAQSIFLDFSHQGGAGGGAARVSLSWFLDGAQTFIIATDIIDFFSGSIMRQTFPCKGKYLRVTVTPLGATPITYTMQITLQQTDWKNHYDGASLALLEGNGVAFVPGLTTITSTKVAYGPAHWSINSDAVVWSYTLSTVNAVGTVKNLVHGTQAFPQGTHLVMVPPLPTRLSFTNGDAVNKNVWYNLQTNLGASAT